MSEASEKLIADIEAAEGRIDEQYKIRGASYRVADNVFHKATKADQQFLDSLLADNRAKAIEISMKWAPHDRYGERMDPDEVHMLMDKTGILVRWDADHPNDIVDCEVGWDKLIGAE